MAAASKRDADEAAFQAQFEKVSEIFYKDNTMEKQDGISETAGWIFNSNEAGTGKTLYLADTHNWSGDVTVPYLNPLPPQVEGYWTHKGALPTGSKGGVAYVDGFTPSSTKWLVAWDTPNNKVYVHVGPSEVTDWDAIEVKLNASMNRDSHYDMAIPAMATAQIHPPDRYPVLMMAWFSFY